MYYHYAPNLEKNRNERKNKKKPIALNAWKISLFRITEMRNIDFFR